MNKYLNGWVWVDRDGMFYAVFGNLAACYSSKENAKSAASSGRCILLPFFGQFNARPLTFAEYAAIGGDL